MEDSEELSLKAAKIVLPPVQFSRCIQHLCLDFEVAWCRRSDTIFSQYNQLGHLLKPHHDPEPGGIHRHILSQIQLQSDWQARFPLLRTLEIKLFFWSSVPVYPDSKTPGHVCLEPFASELVGVRSTGLQHQSQDEEGHYFCGYLGL
jgi:hypothetical protein